MWLGAHPGDPSYLVGADGGRTSLLDALRADPEGLLGRTGARSGRQPAVPAQGPRGGRAAEPAGPPSSAQAAEDRENAAGIPVDAPTRNYRDASHKPELIWASSTRWWASRGPADPRAAACAGRRRARPARRAARRAAGRGGPARTVHHLDHAAAVRAGPGGARAPGRVRAPGAGAASSAARRGWRWSCRAVPRRRGRARRAAAQPGRPATR